MAAPNINDHLSFRPVDDIIRGWDAQPATPPNSPLALDAIATARASIKPPVVPDMQPLIARAWGVCPQGARRTVLRAASIDPARWDAPIHSFTDSERIAIRAAASAAVRVFERVRNAI